MDKEALRQLDRGDIVKHKTTKETFIVTANYGGNLRDAK